MPSQPRDADVQAVIRMRERLVTWSYVHIPMRRTYLKRLALRTRSTVEKD